MADKITSISLTDRQWNILEEALDRFIEDKNESHLFAIDAAGENMRRNLPQGQRL